MACRNKCRNGMIPCGRICYNPTKRNCSPEKKLQGQSLPICRAPSPPPKTQVKNPSKTPSKTRSRSRTRSTTQSPTQTQTQTQPQPQLRSRTRTPTRTRTRSPQSSRAILDGDLPSLMPDEVEENYPRRGLLNAFGRLTPEEALPQIQPTSKWYFVMDSHSKLDVRHVWANLLLGKTYNPHTKDNLNESTVILVMSKMLEHGGKKKEIGPILTKIERKYPVAYKYIVERYMKCGDLWYDITLPSHPGQCYDVRKIWVDLLHGRIRHPATLYTYDQDTVVDVIQRMLDKYPERNVYIKHLQTTVGPIYPLVLEKFTPPPPSVFHRLPDVRVTAGSHVCGQAWYDIKDTTSTIDENIEILQNAAASDPTQTKMWLSKMGPAALATIAAAGAAYYFGYTPQNIAEWLKNNAPTPENVTKLFASHASPPKTTSKLEPSWIDKLDRFLATIGDDNNYHV